TYRAIGSFRDPITGVDLMFVGGAPQPGNFKLFRGALDVTPSHNNRIMWSPLPEFTGFQHRIMSFAVANNQLYFTAKPSLYKRVQDGVSPVWRTVYTFQGFEDNSSGLRGLTAIPAPNGDNREVLLTGAETWDAQILRLIPSLANDTVTPFVEEYYTRSLSSQWVADLKMNYSISAYNNIVSTQDPDTGETANLIGVQLHNRQKPNSGWYFVRRQSSQYELHEIQSLDGTPLIATRTIVISPFPEDQQRVVYLGGWDGFGGTATAWIYRAGIRTVLAGGQILDSGAQLP